MCFDAIFNQWAWQVEACVRVLVAAVLGGCIGLEREHHGRSAGFRTQLLVGLGAALAMVVSLHFEKIFGGYSANTALRIDPARVAYGIMGGIGFLGAGTIVRFGVNVRGMTTAASLWCSAALGLACGFGMYLVAVFATGLVLVALMFLTKMDRLLPVDRYKSVTLLLEAGARDNIEHFGRLFAQRSIQVIDTDYRRDYQTNLETITFHVSFTSPRRSLDLFNFDNEPGIRRMSIR